MEHKIQIFSKYAYSENTMNPDIAENAIKLQKVRAIKNKISGLLDGAAIDADLFRILSVYFNLNNERKPGEVLSNQGIRYLSIISHQLCDLLYQKSSQSKEQLLFRLFIRLNFNKDQIIDYYINKIDAQINDNPDDLENILQCYWNESLNLPKKGIVYTSKNHSLHKEIQSHIQVLRGQHDREYEQANRMTHATYQPLPRLITVQETSSILMYGLNILIKIGILKIHSSYKAFFEALCQLVRDRNGKRFSFGTLKSRYNTYDLNTLYKMNDIIEAVREYNDFQIEIHHKRKK